MPVIRRGVTELRDEQGQQCLYLHSTDIDSIAAPSAKQGRQVCQSRGAVIDGNNFGSIYGGFGVLAYAYKGTWNESQTPNYINNKKATAANGSYGFTPPYFWPGNDYSMAFFAYAPFDEGGSILGKGAGSPTIIYTVPADVTKQNDLLACWYKDIPGTRQTVAYELEFRHLCTAVKFKVGKGLENSITAISIKNIYGSGTYSAASETWTTTGKADGIIYTVDDINNTNTPEGTDLTAGEYTFMMIPQTLNGKATVEVTFIDNDNSEQTLTANISGEWKKGHTVVYKVSRNKIENESTLEVYPSGWSESLKLPGYKYTPNSYSHPLIQVISYTTSYLNGVEQNKELEPWVLEYQDTDTKEWKGLSDENMASNWVQMAKSKGDGSFSRENINLTVKAQKGTAKPVYENHSEQNEKLAAITSLSGVNDLSTNCGKWNYASTANCYIINAPGTYRLPLVYGNAIKDGKTNESAYKSTLAAGTSNILHNFVNYKNENITSPFIETDGNLAAEACLLWYDDKECKLSVSKDLKDGKIKLADGDKEIQYLQFTISAPMRQSNALLAVKDADGNIMWSWHIWMTDYTWGDDLKVTNHEGFVNDIMPVNIGWIDQQETFYKERSLLMRVRQPETGEIKEFTVYQDKYTEIILGNGTTYQFGRKDPTPGMYFCKAEESKTFEEVGEKTVYGGEFKINTSKAADIGHSISHPDEGFFGDDNWFGTSSADYADNLWNVNEAAISGDETCCTVTKSVYDPSPVGYTVAPYDAFTGFVIRPTENEEKYIYYWHGEKLEDINTPYKSLNEYTEKLGWTFYCDNSKTSTIFFPWTKFRNSQGKYTIDKTGQIWLATIVRDQYYDQGFGCVLLYSQNSGVLTHRYSSGGYKRPQGCSVRPVKEKH